MKRKRPERKKIRFIQSAWAPIVLGVVVIIAMLGVWYLLQKRSMVQSPSKPSVEKTRPELPDLEPLKGALRKTFHTRNVSWEKLRLPNTQKETWRVRVPADLPIPSLHLAVKESIAELGMRILSADSEPISGRVFLRIGRQDSCFLQLQLVHDADEVREQGRIALLIDDFGDEWNDFVKSFLNLGAEIAISVIPGRRMSTKVAREMRRMGCEVVLHLPMEPLNASFKYDGYGITTDMSRMDIQKVIQRCLDDVPGATGVNNHMGSKVTSHRPTITNVLVDINTRGLYFVDSRTTDKTVAYDVARMLGMRCGKRDVFLDVDKDRDAIRQSIWELTDKARAKGFAIGIGHCHRRTLEVLRDEIPKIQARGFRFVSLSEVMQ